MDHFLSFICIQRHFPLVEHIHEDQESFWIILPLMRQTGSMNHFLSLIWLLDILSIVSNYLQVLCPFIRWFLRENVVIYIVSNFDW